MQFKVSILIPIYNTSLYLNQCLNSVVNQTLKDIEIICINDGSTDNSLNIIRSFAEKDNRIKIIDKSNSGYGASMNVGLKIASGEYIGIVESDDFIEKNMFEILYNIANKENCDIVKSIFYYFWIKKCRKFNFLKSLPKNKLFNPIDNMQIFFQQPSIWSAIYRTEFIRNNEITFNETAGASYQDTSFNFECLAQAKTIYLVDMPLYYYRQNNPNSSCKDKNKVLCICDEMDRIDGFLKQSKNLEKKLNDVANKIKVGSFLWNYHRIARQHRNKFMNFIHKNYRITINNKYLTTEENDFYKYLKNYNNPFFRIKFNLKQIIGNIVYTNVKNGYRRFYLFNIRILKIKVSEYD